MSRPAPRQFTVLAKRLVTPNMWRLTLGGPGMVDFPPDQETAYIKLRFAQPGSSRPLLRTYTVRQQHAEAIDVDVVRHVHGGPAARWAENAAAGDTIEASGPGPVKRLDHEADWFLLAGDMTALPAIGANIEALPARATGRAIIEVIDAEDRQALSAPRGLAIDWLINPSPGERAELLAEAVREMIWQPGRPAVWAACEFRAMQALRTHLRDEREVERARLYISSYWQLGQNETGHRKSKQADT